MKKPSNAKLTPNIKVCYVLCFLIVSFLVFFPSLKGQAVDRCLNVGNSKVDQSSTNWFQLHPTSGPWNRSGPELMVYDVESKKTILFGGLIPDLLTDEDFTFYDDTWTFDYNTTTWTNQSPSIMPTGREYFGSAYDIESDRMIIFGGMESTGTGSYTEADPETWVYDTNTNTWTNMSPSVSPSPRLIMSMTYDLESDRVILFGGLTRDLSMTAEPFYDDTWAYDYNTNTWEQMSPSNSPLKVVEYGLAYDIESDRCILFGGSLGTSAPIASRIVNETWAYDYNTDTWTKLVTNNAPSPRTVGGIAYNNKSDRIVMFGGWKETGSIPEHYSDTWAFDYNTKTWTEMNSPTHPRRSSSMVYDYSADKMVHFGGFVPAAPSYELNDTWAYHYQLNPPSAPLNFNGVFTDSKVSLTWNSPATDAGSAITNFLIYRGTETGSLTLLTTLGVVSEYEDTSVEKDTKYYYAISAKNAIGEGTLSDEIIVEPKPKKSPGFMFLITASVFSLLVFYRKKRK